MAGRPRNPKVIVPQDTVLSPSDFETVDYVEWDIFLQICEPKKCLEFLARHRLIANSVTCPTCQQPATLNGYVNSSDKFRWRCNNCGFTRSVRYQSIFSHSNLNLTQLIRLIYCWCERRPLRKTAKEVRVSNTIVCDWFNLCRELCAEWVENNQEPIGGFSENGPALVEIDESAFFRRKYHRGTLGPHYWCFGGIERGTRNCFIVSVPNRRKDTLEPIIQRMILPGSRIISDGWRGYEDISVLSNGVYMHDVVIHAQNFVSPEDDEVHTQSIESLWKQAKRNLRNMSGTSQALFPSHLADFVWRYRSVQQKNTFSEFLKLITLKYPF